VLKKEQRACLETVTIQLLDSNLHFRIRTLTNPNDASVDAAEPSLPDQQRPAESSAGGFELGEGEHAQIVGASPGEELEEADRVGQVPGVGDVDGGRAGRGRHAQRARPGDLGRRPRNEAVLVVPPLPVGEVEALHCLNYRSFRTAEIREISL
jgi:hypothetical protein